jgi:hypothetical protein
MLSIDYSSFITSSNQKPIESEASVTISAALQILASLPQQATTAAAPIPIQASQIHAEEESKGDKEEEEGPSREELEEIRSQLRGALTAPKMGIDSFGAVPDSVDDGAIEDNSLENETSANSDYVRENRGKLEAERGYNVATSGVEVRGMPAILLESNSEGN